MISPSAAIEKDRNMISLNCTSCESCPICLGSLLGKKAKILRCGHTYHIRCINKWMEKADTCAMCRKIVNYDQSILDNCDNDLLLYLLELLRSE